MDDRHLYVQYGTDGRRMARELLTAADAKTLIPANASIAIKPNLVVAKPANSGATTHPEIVAGIIDYLRENGFNDITIIESSWVGDNTRRAFEVAGYTELSRRMNVPIYDLKSDSSMAVAVESEEISLCRRAVEADFLINVPVLKGHCQTVMTCAMKNLKGIIPDREKRRFHTMGLDKPIALLNKAFRPGLTLVDAICGDLNFEEGGNPVPMNRLILGADSVLIDSYGASLLGLAPEEVRYIIHGEKLGVGKRFTGKELIEINRPADGQDRAFRPTRAVQGLARCVKADQACSACYGSLIHALNRLDEMGMLSRLREPIHIGQGYQGKTDNGIGIGRCCSGFAQGLGGCPPNARAILDFLLTKV